MWGSLWVHLVLMSLWIYWISLEKNLDICFHHKAREVFNHYLFKEDFHSFLSSPPGAPECSCHCLTVPEVPHKGCHCFVTGFLLLPDWVISTACLLDCWPSLLYPQICCWFHPVCFFFSFILFHSSTAIDSLLYILSLCWISHCPPPFFCGVWWPCLWAMFRTLFLEACLSSFCLVIFLRFGLILSFGICPLF